jgi:hypothetical protein
LTPANDLFEPANVDGRGFPSIRQLAGFGATLKEFMDNQETVDQRGKPYPLGRLAGGWALGTSDSGDVLYLDPADQLSVWVFHHDGGDVEKVAQSFRSWRRKAKRSG